MAQCHVSCYEVQSDGYDVQEVIHVMIVARNLHEGSGMRDISCLFESEKAAISRLFCLKNSVWFLVAPSFALRSSLRDTGPTKSGEIEVLVATIRQAGEQRKTETGSL